MDEESARVKDLERGGVSRVTLAYAATLIRQLTTRMHSDPIDLSGVVQNALHHSSPIALPTSFFSHVWLAS